MTKVPAPPSLCLQVSTRAAQICSEKFNAKFFQSEYG